MIFKINEKTGKTSTKEMINGFNELGWELSSKLVLEISKNGNIRSWINSLSDKLIEKIVLIESPDDLFDKKDTLSFDVLAAVSYLINYNNKNTGASSEDIIKHIRYLIIRAIAKSVNNKVAEALGSDFKNNELILEDDDKKKDNWDISGGPVYINPILKNKLKELK